VQDGYEYRSADGGDVIGTLTTSAAVHWSVVSENVADRPRFTSCEPLRQHRADLRGDSRADRQRLARTGAASSLRAALPPHEMRRASRRRATSAVDLPKARRRKSCTTKVFNGMVGRLRDSRPIDSKKKERDGCSSGERRTRASFSPRDSTCSVELWGRDRAQSHAATE